MLTWLAGAFAVVALGAVSALVHRAKPGDGRRLALQILVPVLYAAALGLGLYLIAGVGPAGTLSAIGLVAIAAIVSTSGRPHLVMASEKDFEAERGGAVPDDVDDSPVVDRQGAGGDEVRPGPALDPDAAERAAFGRRIRRNWRTFLILSVLVILGVVYVGA